MEAGVRQAVGERLELYKELVMAKHCLGTQYYISAQFSCSVVSDSL